MGLKVVVRAGVRKGVGMGDGLKLEIELVFGPAAEQRQEWGAGAVQDQKGFRVGNQARFTPAHCPPQVDLDVRVRGLVFHRCSHVTDGEAGRPAKEAVPRGKYTQQ